MQTITITNKDNLKLTDMTKLKAFNDKEFLISTSLGDIKIIGSNLTMDNINTSLNELSISGNIKAIFLSDITEKKEGFVKKLFKWNHIMNYT